MRSQRGVVDTSLALYPGVPSSITGSTSLSDETLAVCRARRGLPVGFLLLQYSVLFTVESLSVLYLLVIS